MREKIKGNNKVRIFQTILALSLIILTIFGPSSTILAAEDIVIAGKAAILIDPYSGKILYEKNIHERLSMASITKLMTCLIAMEMIETGRLSPDEMVTVSKEAAALEGARIYLVANERVRLEDLIIATVIRSANDAAYAIGEHISGTIEEFAVLMNEKAKLFGMNETHFSNPEGLEDPENYSTTHDIAILSLQFYKHPQLMEWAGTKNITIRNGRVSMTNSNNLLSKYTWATGVKTGYTEKAGYCLVGSANKNGTELISVVMGLTDDQSRIQETIKLLDWGFENYVTIKAFSRGKDMGEIKISNAKPYRVPVFAIEDMQTVVPVELVDKVEITIEKLNVKAPFEAGTVIGRAKMIVEGAEIASVDLAAEVPTLKVNIFIRIWRFIAGIFGRD